LWVVRRNLEDSVMTERQSGKDAKPSAPDVIRTERLRTEDVEAIHDEASRIGVAAVAKALEESTPE
jgi:hypothetical protein